jgi:hypothetical protein
MVVDVTYDEDVEKLSNFTYFRRKYLRPFYLPFFNIIHWNYLYRNRMILARRLTRDFNISLKNHPESIIVIGYDNSNSPPTYGDYFVVLMVARFISMSGNQVRFEISDTQRGGKVWDTLRVEEQDSFVLDQIFLAQEYLNDNCQIIVKGKFQGESTYKSNEKMKWERNCIEVQTKEFYQWAPYFLHLLIQRHDWKIPSNFLLKAKIGRPDFNYVTWHIRKSTWAKYRDTNVASLKRDFEEIRHLFPTHKIIVLSNQEGLEFSFRMLDDLNPSFTALVSQGKVLPQPDRGYIGAISWILNSDFYFQRSGGGIGIIPIFSSVPYVMYSIEKTSFFGHHRNKKIAPWSTENQIFKRLFVKKKTFPFSKSLN